MKKAWLVILAASLLLFCCASAFAAVRLPAGLTAIGDEAFMNAQLTWLVAIPDGTKTIGRRAFSGSSAAFFYLPPTLEDIAPDAFDKGTTFELLPGTYAQKWCRENGFDYDIIRVYVSTSRSALSPGSSITIRTAFPYASRVSAFRWEASADQRTWKTVAEGPSKEYTLQYADAVKLTNSKLFVRCRATVNGVLLEAGSEVELSVLPDKLAFSKNSKAINADSVYLGWNDMGPGTRYYVRQLVDGQWKNIAILLDKTGYTVYGLDKSTQYRFSLSAVTADFEGKETSYETKNDITLTTAASGATAVNVTSCKSYGTAISIEWEVLDRASYDVEIGEAGQEKKTYAHDITADTGNKINLYVFKPNTQYEILVTAHIRDNSLESGWRVLRSPVLTLTTGAADPAVVLEAPVVTSETVSLRWSALPGVQYAVYMSEDGGQEVALEPTTNTFYDVGGLDRSRQYRFRVKAFLGKWSSFSEPVTVEALPKNADVQYRALLIGEGNFQKELYAARNYGDVEMLGSLLASAKTPTGGAYTCLRRQDLSSQQILDEIRSAFRGADDNDVSLFFIATHGDTEEIGNLAGNLSTVDREGNTGKLNLEDLAAALGSVRGTVIVWLGSCGSGAAIYDEDVKQNSDAAFAAAAAAAFAAQDSTIVLDAALAPSFVAGGATVPNRGEFRQAKFHVLTASRYHEMSWGIEKFRYNLFPKFICDGATVKSGRMPADANRDGKLTQHELFRYIKSREEDSEHFVNQNVQEYPLNSDYVLFVS